MKRLKIVENIPVVESKGEKKDEIVVYKPDKTLRLEVKLEYHTVWLTQAQIAELFGVTVPTINYHIKEIFATGELQAGATIRKILIVRKEGTRRVQRLVDFYNLDMIISVGYRVNSIRGVQFRQWATRVLTEHLLRGYTVNSRMNQLEDRVDRRLLEHGQRLDQLESKVEIIVKTSQPPVQGVFYDGQVFDAHVFAAKHILTAEKSILLIDNWVDIVTLELLAKKAKGVSVELVTTRKGNRLAASDIATFNAQYGGLSVLTTKNFHDRYLIIDDKIVYLFGASLKDLGRKCFCAMKIEGADVPKLKARI